MRIIKQAIVAALFYISVLACADTNSDLQHFYSGLGFDTHINTPTTYQSQAAGYATLGSIYERNSVRNIQIMHIDVPGFRSGCGGIDLFAGAFSFIKSDQLVKFMQSILSAGAGYALNLALEVELPEVAHALQYMQTIANKINSGNFNSCSMAEDLVGGAWPKSRASQQQVCQDVGTHTGFFSDWAKSRSGCSTGSDMDSELNKAKADPKYKYRVYKNTNVIWDDVVERNAFLSGDEKLGELYMSISGTVVFDQNGAITTYGSKVTNANFIKALLYGGKLPTYTCADSSKTCLNVSFSSSTYQTITATGALVPQVKAMLSDIYTRIKSNQTLTDGEIGLISLTQSPVFSVISANAQEGLGIQGLDTFAQMVATDLLADYLSNALDVIQSSLAGTQLDKNNIQALIHSIQTARTFVDKFDQKTRAKFQQALSINLNVQRMMAQAMNTLSPQLRQATQEMQ